MPAATRNVLTRGWGWLIASRRRRVIAVVAVLAVVGMAFTWRWFVSPSTAAIDDTPESDAVVMFVGGRGERLETALEVIAANKAPVLVIPNRTTPTWPQANAICDGSVDVGVEVLCPTPDPDTTRGEAGAIAVLADEHDWEVVVVVTSTYHAERATLLLGRCFDGDIATVAASRDLSVWGWATKLTHEWAGVSHAHLIARGC